MGSPPHTSAPSNATSDLILDADSKPTDRAPESATQAAWLTALLDTQAPSAPPTPTPPPPSPSPDPYSWSQLMRRVFSIDVLHCHKCGGRRKLISLLTDPPVVRRILRHLDLSTEPPPIAPARPCPQLTFDFEA